MKKTIDDLENANHVHCVKGVVDFGGGFTATIKMPCFFFQWRGITPYHRLMLLVVGQLYRPYFTLMAISRTICRSTWICYACSL